MREDDEDLPEIEETGDGEFETEAEVVCPYCGETVEIVLDPAGGAQQEYVEDCEVCCRPWKVVVTYGDDGSADVTLAEAQ